MAIPVKLTRAHQVTLPKRLLEEAGWLNQQYFVADLQGDALLLRPMTPAGKPIASYDDLRRHFAALGITECDVADAVQWARQPSKRAGKSRRRGRR